MSKKKGKPVSLSAEGITVGPAILSTPALRSFGPMPDEHPFYALVGRVASEWSHLEHKLDLIIWALAEIDGRVGACLTAQMMGVWPRYNAIEALLVTRGKGNQEIAQLIKATRSLSGKSRQISDRRNRLIHDPWYVDAADGQTAQLRSMPKSDQIYGLLDRDRNELDALLEAIKGLSNQVDALGRGASAALQALSKGRQTNTA